MLFFQHPHQPTYLRLSLAMVSCVHALTRSSWPGLLLAANPLSSMVFCVTGRPARLLCYATHMVFSSPFSPPLQLQPNRSATKYNEIFLGRTYVNGLNRKVPLSLALLNSFGAIGQEKIDFRSPLSVPGKTFRTPLYSHFNRCQIHSLINESVSKNG